MSVLPDKLLTGDRLVSCKGVVVTVHRTIAKYEGMMLYRLRFKSGVLSNGRYTRDDLQELECVMIEEKVA